VEVFLSDLLTRGECIVRILGSHMPRHGGECSLTLRLNAKSNHTLIASSLINIQHVMEESGTGGYIIVAA
jgi:hypothetical protein